jgi:long-chain acyl-CoA synthetase
MLNLLLDNIAEKFPLKAALIFEDETYTYADLLSRTQNLATSLLERGIDPGDRVAFLLPNSLEIVVCYYACFKIGAIAVPLNIRFGAEMLRYVINHSGARVLISEPELFTRVEKIRASLPEVEQYYLVGNRSDFDGAVPFSQLLEATLSVDRRPVFGESSPAAIYYTSGTTGLPKAVIHTHSGLARATSYHTAVQEAF